MYLEVTEWQVLAMSALASCYIFMLNVAVLLDRYCVL